MASEVQVGDAVTFVDALGAARPALVTAVFGEQRPSINVVFVSNDVAAQDQYGRQTLRETSVVHKDQQHAHGMCWTRS